MMQRERKRRMSLGWPAPGVFLAALALFLQAGHASAETASGARFLKIAVGARSVGMGGAYTAVANDATAIYWNPAGLAPLSRKELGLMHSEWLLGTKYDFLGYAHPLSWGTLGLGISRLGAGELQGRGPGRETQGGFSASDAAYALGYGKALGGRANLGLSVKYLTSSIGSDTASTFALDVGITRKLAFAPVSLGASVQNLGPGLKFVDQRDPLPLAVTLGGAYHAWHLLDLALDVKYEPHDKRTSVAIGTEYTVFSVLALRAGYASYTAQALAGSARPNTPLAGFGGGFGLKLGSYSADYAITPFGDLGNVQRFSLGVRF